MLVRQASPDRRNCVFLALPVPRVVRQKRSEDGSSSVTGIPSDVAGRPDQPVRRLRLPLSSENRERRKEVVELGHQSPQRGPRSHEGRPLHDPSGHALPWPIAHQPFDLDPYYRCRSEERALHLRVIRSVDRRSSFGSRRGAGDPVSQFKIGADGTGDRHDSEEQPRPQNSRRARRDRVRQRTECRAAGHPCGICQDEATQRHREPLGQDRSEGNSSSVYVPRRGTTSRVPHSRIARIHLREHSCRDAESKGTDRQCPRDGPQRSPPSECE